MQINFIQCDNQCSNDQEELSNRDLQSKESESEQVVDKEENSDSKNIVSVEKEEQESQNESIQRQKNQKTKKCYNKLCNSHKIFKRIKSKIENSKYRSFCKSCYNCYASNQFCQFCEQIYGNTVNEDDDKNWIGCDNCDRWNHISCEVNFRIQDLNMTPENNTRYQCVNCTNKNKQNNINVKRQRQNKEDSDNPYTYERVNASKKKTSRQVMNQQKNLVYSNNSQNFMNVFNRRRQNLPALQQMLHNLNWKLAITDEQIREDLNKFRIAIGAKQTNGNYEDEEDDKKKRRKNERK